MSITLAASRPSLARVRNPSPRLREAFDDYRRLRAAYDRLLAEEPDNLVAIHMVMADLAPVERHVTALLQKAQTAAANSPRIAERAQASQREARRAKPNRPRGR